MKIFSKNKYKQEGSILILTLLALVGALSIAVAMSSISIVERKMTTKSRKSVTAFQAANSGIEWAMKKLNDAEVNSGKVQTIEDAFGIGSMQSDGKISCPSGANDLFASGDNTGCEIYLLGGSNQNRTVITADNTSLDKVVAIRSTGKYGKNEEQVGRALEAYAMPNCAGGEERVGDFCVESRLSSGPYLWGEASVYCIEQGKRLCTAGELLSIWKMNSMHPGTISLNDPIGSKGEWTAAAIDKDQAIFLRHVQPVMNEGKIGADRYHVRCCRNR